VEMITQRPVIGSFRNSGKAILLERGQSFGHGRRPPGSDCTASGGGEKAFRRISCGILHWGAKGVFMQADDRGLAGELSIAMTSNRHVRRQMRQEVLRGASQEVLFARVTLQVR
jgi:hypothetical protein